MPTLVAVNGPVYDLQTGQTYTFAPTVVGTVSDFAWNQVKVGKLSWTDRPSNVFLTNDKPQVYAPPALEGPGVVSSSTVVGNQITAATVDGVSYTYAYYVSGKDAGRLYRVTGGGKMRTYSYSSTGVPSYLITDSVDGGGSLTVTGDLGVGNVLTAKLPAGQIGTIAFYLDGVAISGATANNVNSLTYTQQAGDMNGKKITARASNVVTTSNELTTPTLPLTVLAASIAAGAAATLGLTFSEAMDTSYTTNMALWSVPEHMMSAVTYPDSTHGNITLTPAMLPGEQRSASLRWLRNPAGQLIPETTIAIQNAVATPANAAPVLTDTLRFSGSSSGLTFANGASHNRPNSDWCDVFVFRADTAGTAGIYKWLYNNGALGAAGTVNIMFQHPTGTRPGAVEVRVCGDTGSVITLLSQLPKVDGVWYVLVLQRNAGTLQLKICPIMGAVVTEATSTSLTAALTSPSTPTIGMDTAQTASRNFIGCLQRYYKGNFALSDAEIQSIATGTVPSALSGRTWSIGMDLTANTTTYTDNTGNGNTATRISTNQTADVNGGPTFGASLQLLQYQDKRVWQRPVSGTRPIPISGYWNGTTGDVIQARAIRWSNGATINTWADITTSAVSGYFNGELQVASSDDWMVVEVRSKTNPQIVTRQLSKSGVGVVVMVAGQSQTLGMFNYITGQTGASDLTSRFHPDQQGWAQPNGTGIRTFLNAIQPQYNCPVAAVVGAVGGTGLIANEGAGAWLDRSSLSIWNRLIIPAWNYGGGFEVCIFNVGGSDARQSVTYAQQLAGLDTLLADMRTLSGRGSDLIFMMSGLYRYEAASPTPASLASRYYDIRRAEQDWLTSKAGDPNVIDVGATVDLPVNGDAGLHWTEASHIRHAQRCVHSLFARLGVGGYTSTAKGAVATGASRSGTAFTIAHSGTETLRTRLCALNTVAGSYADATALQTAFPAAANAGKIGIVSASGVRTEYLSNGTAWVAAPSTLATLQSSYAASSYSGKVLVVVSGATRTEYISNGSAWSNLLPNVIDLALEGDLNYATLLTMTGFSFAPGQMVATLSADPGGAVRSRIGYGTMPGGATVSSDTTNFIYDNRTIGLSTTTGGITAAADAIGAPVNPTVADLIAA